MTTTIRVSKEIRNELMSLKFERGYENMNTLIADLLSEHKKRKLTAVSDLFKERMKKKRLSIEDLK